MVAVVDSQRAACIVAVGQVTERRLCSIADIGEVDLILTARTCDRPGKALLTDRA